MSDVFVGSDQRPVWSPDGQSVYVLASDQGSSHIHRVNLDENTVSAVTSGERRLTAFDLTRDGRSLDILGHYDPRKDPVVIEVDAEKASRWLSQGATPSDTVVRLFKRVGILPEAR